MRRPHAATVLLAAAACGALAPAASHARDTATVPPVECVRTLREARVAEERGEPAAALDLLRRARREHPEQIVPLLTLLSFHRRHPLPADDAAELRRGLARLLEDPERPVSPGALRFLFHDPDADDEDLELVLRAAGRRMERGSATPRMLEAVILLQLRLDRPADARDDLARLMEMNPSDDLRWRAVFLDLHLERWESALTLLEPWIRGDDKAVMARKIAISVLGRLGRIEESLEQLDRLASMVPDPSFVRATRLAQLRQIAWDLRDAGRDDEAENIFREIVTLDPEDDETRSVILHLYADTEERAAMERDHRRSLEAVHDPDALLERGAALLAAGDAESAIDLLDRAAAALPRSEIAWFNLATAAVRLERWDLAERASARAAELNAERADTWLNRGIALHGLERCAEAVASLERALKLRPDLGQAHYYLWACHKQVGDTGAALRHLELYNRYQEQRLGGP